MKYTKHSTTGNVTGQSNRTLHNNSIYRARICVNMAHYQALNLWLCLSQTTASLKVGAALLTEARVTMHAARTLEGPDNNHGHRAKHAQLRKAGKPCQPLCCQQASKTNLHAHKASQSPVVQHVITKPCKMACILHGSLIGTIIELVLHGSCGKGVEQTHEAQ